MNLKESALLKIHWLTRQQAPWTAKLQKKLAVLEMIKLRYSWCGATKYNTRKKTASENWVIGEEVGLL